MKQDHLHNLDTFLESRNEHNEQRQEEDSDDIEFQTCCEDVTNGYSSPTLWTQTRKQHDSTLMPHYDYFGNPFPGSRLEMIKDSRSHLMKMIQNMPESSFELSLKDIVDDVKKTTEVEGRNDQECIKEKVNKRPVQKVKTLKRSEISRSESMDSGVFLLKMFLPVSRKKLTPRKCSKVSPKTSVDESEKTMNREWWRIIFVVIKENRYSRSIKKSMSFNSSSKNRLVKRNSKDGWSSFNSEKCTPRKQGGCLF